MRRSPTRCVTRVQQPGPAQSARMQKIRFGYHLACAMHEQPALAYRDRIAIRAEPEADRAPHRPEAAASLSIDDHVVFAVQVGEGEDLATCIRRRVCGSTH